MATLIARLREALSPQFRVLHEIASGGMGVVFLGHDPALDRPVAIKVLRPELASAVGVERFLREARILARLRHPNIVPVYQGGTAGGLLYHVLELQQGETLAQRLERGPLSPPELRAVADGLLSALAEAHMAGVIHRDIKPANIFLNDLKVVVGDFGIAATAAAEEPLTAPGGAPGTAAYMSPEQVRGEAVTPRADLYAAALVLLESAGGRGFRPSAGGAAPVGGRLPRGWARPLRRALAAEPERRWDSALALRIALLAPQSGWRVASMVAVAAAALLWAGWRSLTPDPFPARFVLAIDDFSTEGGASGARMADSIRGAVARRLAGLPDFVVDTVAGRPATLRVSGRVEQRDGALFADLLVATPDGRSRAVATSRVAPAAWRSLVDTLTRELFLVVWGEDLGGGSPLPRGALPVSTLGTERWLQAEFAYGEAQWSLARQEYEEAEALDSSCLICAYRILDLDRWLGRNADTLRLARLLGGISRFPPEFQSVIRAIGLPVRARIEALRALADQHREFFDAHYLLGDELLHRGPLVGVPRHEAIGVLREARRLRPEFAAVLEHLAWAFIAEGYADSARALLDDLAAHHPAIDPFGAELRKFHELAWQWRFRSAEEARGWSRRLLTDPVVIASPALVAGPRALPALGAFGGAVEFGQLVSEVSRDRHARAGLLAMLLGLVAQGRVAAAGEALHRLRRQIDDPIWRLTAIELAAVLDFAGDPLLPREELRDQLNGLAARGDWLPTEAARIAWSRSLVMPGAIAGALPAPLALLDSARRRASSDPVGALALTDTISTATFRTHEPAAGAVARLLRAEWYGALSRHTEAAAELLWAEHSDFTELPGDRVQAAEFDWALGTISLWRRAGHLEASGDHGDTLCRIYRELERRWQGADPSHAPRLERARARVTTLGCPGAS